MKRAWVYILKYSDGSYYVGCTSNIEKRIGEHSLGLYGGYTSSRRPVLLIWSQEFSDIRDAVAAERKLKKWTRAKKEALMAGDFSLLHELSKSTATKRQKQSTPFDSTGTRQGSRSG